MSKRKQDIYSMGVFHKFGELCGKGIYEVCYDSHTAGASCDISIRKDHKAYVVVNLSNTLVGLSALDAAYSQLMICARRFNARFIVFSEGDVFHIQDLITESRDDFNAKHTFEEIFNMLQTPSVLTFNANEHIKPVRKILKKHGISVGLKNGSLRYDNKWNTVSLTHTIEKNLFEKIVGKIYEGEVYRFSSLETLFATLDKESYRLVALEGMNDKEDGDFLWKSLYGYDANIEEFKKQDETVYIMSCTDATDIDLNMWRLYACDTTGMCMRMKVNPLGLRDSGFVLAHVVYGDDDKLKCLKELISYFRHLPMPITFILQQWNVWRAFFKNADYSVEKEVRLLYVKSRDLSVLDASDVENGWILTNDCKVFSEYVTFKNARAEKFPLKIENIILGPNSSERETNKKQITNMLKTKKKLLATTEIDKVVSISSIVSYRTGRR